MLLCWLLGKRWLKYSREFQVCEKIAFWRFKVIFASQFILFWKQISWLRWMQIWRFHMFKKKKKIFFFKTEFCIRINLVQSFLCHSPHVYSSCSCILWMKTSMQIHLGPLMRLHYATNCNGEQNYINGA